MFKKREPIPPENVRVVLPDDTVVHVECRYDGKDREGQHRWTAIYPIEIGSLGQLEGLKLNIDMMPPRTSLGLEIVYPEGHSER